ncbi:MAG TPA: outer membrane beta-barrel protein, partial [Chitinophagaceae bacterium]|nr:outer membrane beta-barrel protein [Chitinophagaceae bacterium]
SVAHSIGVNAFSFDMKSSVSYSLNLNGTINKDAVIRQRTVDENGVQVSMPVNTNGVWRGFISGNIRKQYKFNKDLQSSVNLNVFGQYNRNLVLLNANRSNVNNFTFNPGVNASLNWKDKIEVTQRYSPSWSKSTYEEDIYPGLEFWRHTASTELVVRMPRRIVWETTLDYTYNPQVADGMQKNVYRWNAGINFLFLKQDKGQLKLSVYDLLNQNNNISRSIRDNYIRDTETLVLRRYFLLTFTYNLRDFKAAKVGGRNNFLFF